MKIKIGQNKISLDEELRDTIKIKTNLTAGTIRNTITSLVKKKMLLKDSRYKAVYPEYFFKGKISDSCLLYTSDAADEL